MDIELAAHTEPIPGYTLVERLGIGGFGEVWKAIAPGGIPKAIKFIKGSLNDIGDGNVAATQELKALNRVKNIHHPFILGLERADIIDGQLIIVSELADKNLMDHLQSYQRKGLPGIPRAELLRYMHEAAEALDLMNGDYQLQHLDIKPQNLFLVHNHVKIADFGLVKDLEGRSATITSGITPLYASPETFEGKVTHYSDQYSFAIVYQELLTGCRPINGTNARQLLMNHVRGKPDLEPLPPGDRLIVARALSKKPGDRFPTCMEFVRTLSRAPATPVAARAVKLSAPKPAAYPAEPMAPTPAAPPSNVDTVEMGPKGKDPTVEIDKKQVKARSADPQLPCPNCGKILIDPLTVAWCAGCGYSRSIGKAGQLGSMPHGQESWSDRLEGIALWPFGAVGACLALVVLTAYRNELGANSSHATFLWAVWQAGLGFALYLAGHIGVVALGMKENRETELWKFVDPFTIWPRAFALLPDARWSICLGSLGCTALLCALTVFITTEFGTHSKAAAPSPGVVVDLPPKAQETREPANEPRSTEGASVAQFTPAKAEPTEKTQSTRCVVLGYVPGSGGKVSELIIGHEDTGGRVQYAGTVKVEGEPAEVTKLQEALSSATKGTQPPNTPSGLKATWIETKYACTVNYEEKDTLGVLKKAVLRKLTLRQ